VIIRKACLAVGVALLVLLAFSTNNTFVHGQDKVPDDFGANGALNDSNITLKEALTYALQDEYLSQVRYDVIREQFGEDVRPFAQLEYANKRHIQYLYQLSRENNIAIPKNNNNIVYFLELPSNIKAAYKNEIRYENQNISMYDKFINRTDLSTEVKDLMRHMQEASRDHLRQLRVEYNRY
jgi:hypothetical protein